MPPLEEKSANMGNKLKVKMRFACTEAFRKFSKKQSCVGETDAIKNKVGWKDRLLRCGWLMLHADVRCTAQHDGSARATGETFSSRTAVPSPAELTYPVANFISLQKMVMLMVNIPSRLSQPPLFGGKKREIRSTSAPREKGKGLPRHLRWMRCGAARGIKARAREGGVGRSDVYASGSYFLQLPVLACGTHPRVVCLLGSERCCCCVVCVSWVIHAGYAPNCPPFSCGFHFSSPSFFQSSYRLAVNEILFTRLRIVYFCFSFSCLKAPFKTLLNYRNFVFDSPISFGSSAILN